MNQKACLLSALLLAGYGCNEERVACEIVGPAAHAMQKAGPIEGGYLLPNGVAITPVGEQLVIENFPLNLILIPGKNLVVVTNNGTDRQSLQVIDTNDMSIKQTIAKTEDYQLFVGLALSQDGSHLYAAGGGAGLIYVYHIATDGTLEEVDSIVLAGFPGALRLTSSGTLLAAEHISDKLAIIDSATGSLLSEINLRSNQPEYPFVYPYWIELSRDEKRAFVSHWGERHVSVIDLEARIMKKRIEVGKNPEGLVLSTDGNFLYVANSDTDDISVIDTRSEEVVDTISVALREPGTPGASPSSLAITPDGKYLFVACAGINSIAVIDLSNRKLVGRIPTAWYPTGVLLSEDASRLYATCAKGYGSGSNPQGHYVGTLNLGVFARVELADALDRLEELTSKVSANNTRHSDYFHINCEPAGFPLPATPRRPNNSPIKHVILVVKENKTYDQLFGDLKGTEADADLVMYGEDYTPNMHALARQFTNLDNFYADSEVSVQGHMWLTASNCNDYVEKAWLGSNGGRVPIPGVEPAGRPENEFFFHHLMKNRVDFLVYGESVGTIAELLGLFGREVIFEKYVDQDWPGGVIWSIDTKDEERARYFASRLQYWEEHPEEFPEFIFMLLPDDHTYGVNPGKLAPESMVSDNDYALGLVVEAISHSSFWPSTAVFVTEDDPQSGADHIDAHRTVCLVISPWVKHGYVSSVHYSFPSLFKTIELILGIGPLYQYDAVAPGMYDVFYDQPDFTPYQALPRRIPDRVTASLEKMSLPLRRLAEKSLQMDFSEPDSIKNHQMGWVLREYFRLSQTSK